MSKQNMEFKDSGIPWIGQIPKHWEIKRLKFILNERKENNKPVKTDFILSLTNEKGVIPYSEKGAQGNISKDDITGYKLAYPNDIILNSMNVVIGSVGLSSYFGAISPVYYALYSKENSNIKFYNYVFQTSVFQNSLKGLGNGILEIRMRIPMSNLNNVFLPLPPLNEQEKIAEFLDKKCEIIDKRLNNLERQSKSLKEYKKSLISECVTKGLNPKNMEFKDSGIPWIGQIPKHWEIKKLKYITDYNTETLSENTSEDYEFDYVDIGSVTYENGIEQLQHLKFKNAPSRARRIVKKDDVILSTVRTYLKATASIPENDHPIIVSTGFITFRAKTEILSLYLKYAIQCDVFISDVESRSIGISYPAITSTEVIQMKF